MIPKKTVYSFVFSTAIDIVSLVNYHGSCVHHLRQSAKISSHAYYCTFTHLRETDGHISSKCCSNSSGLGRRMAQGQGSKTAGLAAFLSLTNKVGWIQAAPEAKLSRALSCDRAVITRWINTCVVEVKWCYVAACYWTWRVTIHDTDTFFSFFFLPKPR